MKITKLLITLLLAFLIVFNISKITFPTIVNEANGFNYVVLNYAYVFESANIEFNGYDENNKLELNKREFVNKSLVNANLESNINEIFKNEITFNFKAFFIPLLSSHKLEIVLNGKGNLFLVRDLLINEREVHANEIVNNLVKNHDIQIGTVSYDKETVVIKLLKDRVSLDLTKILKPVTLTKAEKSQFDEDYNFLSYVYLGICFLVVLGLIYFISKKVNGELFKASFVSLGMISAINVSFFVINYEAILYGYGTYFENVLLFEQNYIPLLLLFLFPLILCNVFKNKWVKGFLAIIPLPFIIVLLVDNCLQIALNVRFNFRFAGFAGDIKYVYDFIIMYLLTPSAWFMIASLVLTVILGIFVIRSNSLNKFSNLTFIILLLIASSVWGTLPTDNNELNLSKISNVFQVNGYSFYAVGDVSKDYEETYEARDSLDFKWEEHVGQNKQKNIIIILVESWSCNLTKICGTDLSYMPNLEQIGKENWLFTNYHSMAQSTSLSLLSVLKSFPQFTANEKSPDKQNKFIKQIFAENDLLTNLKNNGYRSMFISSTDNVFGMNETIQNVAFDEEVYADNEAFSNVKERYVFNSVNDNVMFDYIINRLKTEKSDKFIYVTKTASNHTPYNSPIGFNDMKLAFKYTDNAVAKFISELDEMNYFKDGIVVFFGDHPIWSDVNKPINSFDLYNVPLVIVDGEHKGIVNSNSFTHASLGVMLQDLMLPKYKMNRFNSNPILEGLDYEREPLLVYDYEKPNELEVKYHQKVGKLIFSGNDTYIEPKGVFSEEEEKLILGFIAWIK